ncbi:Tlg2-vesicle protein [Schaereria dolodes]|nr:Tlg2-vesicle protein [Schaereria dolodes]
MIRLCPLPYSLSNGAISTFPTVQPLMFALATAIATPKLAIAVFIGSRMRAIAKSGGKMDITTKAINWITIVGGIILGAVTGWWIYQKTIARSRQLEAEERIKVRQAPYRPRSRSFTDDPSEDIEDTAGTTILHDDDIDFLDTDGAGDMYRDGFDDEDGGDPFRYDDEDEDAIGLDKQRPRQ